MTFHWSGDQELFVPVVDGEADAGRDQRICPGHAMDMQSLADKVYGRQPEDPVLGESIGTWACHSSDPGTRSRAASGGFISEALRFLLSSGEIDAAYCASAEQGPWASRGRIVRSVEELEGVAGSHYHPVEFGASLCQLMASDDRFAFVGLPCEVAALRELMSYRSDLADRCAVVIGLFCGGVNRFDSGIGIYLRDNGIDPSDVTHIDYRDGTWPGMIALRTRDGRSIRLPRVRGNTRMGIIRYMVAFQGYGMLLRCRICPDQISDFADIAVGDPHIPRFKSRDSDGWSAVVVRTPRGDDLFRQLLANGRVVREELTRDEVVRSQGYTLENRRRATVYAGMARRLGMAAPHLVPYRGLEQAESWHQHVYAWVDLVKIRYRRLSWLRPLYVPLQVFEYLFLTFSPRLFLQRLKKVTSNR